MPSSIPKTNLEHWAILRRVVECGSFAEAAISLERSQSAISYSVSKLQESLGFPIMEMQGRRAVLTEHGKLLLAEVSPLIDELVSVETAARAESGTGPLQVRLLVDALFPREWLGEALQQLQVKFPDVLVDIHETVRLEMSEFMSLPFDLAVVLPELCPVVGQRICEMDFALVARKDHPLANAHHSLTQAEMARHLRVFIRENRLDGTEVDRPHGRIWTVSSLESAVAAVERGMCFGWLPTELISGQLERGDLVMLNAGGVSRRKVSLDLVYRDVDRASTPVKFMAQCLASIHQANG
ncbi:LysR family transcriptional regulator [Thioclava sp. GXIMD4216]|uniref:LysR family transcriptional regulator n=1 Tax=Thioclava litoralis TaxID=3076557 RepID=A0ABZ1E373_9RHOB|nr:LysR family transcriptional regulator [Thioclava sp. FTW29]